MEIIFKSNLSNNNRKKTWFPRFSQMSDLKVYFEFFLPKKSDFFKTFFFRTKKLQCVFWKIGMGSWKNAIFLRVLSEGKFLWFFSKDFSWIFGPQFCGGWFFSEKKKVIKLTKSVNFITESVPRIPAKILCSRSHANL